MHYRPIHSFSLDPTQMQQIQAELREQIELIAYTEPVQYVAGVDLAYFANQAIAVIIVMEYESKQVVETVQHQATASFEYVPGYLAFRELPVFLAAWEKLTTEPDLVFF